MNIHFKLYPHQKVLFTSKEKLLYLRCGRGSGKTHAASLLVAIRLLEGKRILCLSQSYKQLTEVMIPEVCRKLDSIIPGDYTLNKTAQKITYKSGAIFFGSYESLENLRGFDRISLAVLDEAELAPANIFEVLVFCLRGEGIDPQIVMLSTPRSGSWLKRFCIDNNVKIITASTADNKKITPEQIELMKRTSLSEAQWRREFYGEAVDDDSGGTLFTNAIMEDAPETGTSYAIGVDPSGLGSDFNVLILRKGNSIKKIEKLAIATAKDLYTVIRNWVNEFGMDYLSHIAIDQAYGLRLKEVLDETDLAMFVRLVPFGASSDIDAYANKRCEMYVTMKHSFEDNGIHGLTEEIRNELAATKYELNSRDKIQLVPKEDIKLVIGHSPDAADALALTYFEELQPKGLLRSRREEIKRRLM